MSYELSEKVIKYLEACYEETLDLIEAICKIPAPSHHEQKRAEFVKGWLEANGAEGVYIDDALNVVYPVGCIGDGANNIIVFAAHTDTVFPDTEPMPVRRDDKYMYSPGVGDDTACLAQLMMIARYVAKNGLTAKCGIIFVANSCEEGLGNLKGTRRLMKDYEGRIAEFYTFDSQYKSFVNKCVGSHRYEVTFATEGGHSYGAFGNRNALHAMSQLICRLYDCKVPVIGDSKTTFNVGVAEGGTSVNTIAQNAKMLYEYRSDDAECLEKMREFFFGEIEKAKLGGIADITVETVGVRPCGGNVDKAHLEEMSRRVIKISEKYSGIKCHARSGSTDCNIPMSMGVPAVSVGSYIGSGAHTREEKLLMESVSVGLKITAHLILGFFGNV